MTCFRFLRKKDGRDSLVDTTSQYLTFMVGVLLGEREQRKCRISKYTKTLGTVVVFTEVALIQGGLIEEV